MYCTGVHPRELLCLRWSQVDIPNHQLTVCGDRKYDGRLVPFANRVTAALQARLERESNAVFVLGANPEAVLEAASERLESISMQVLSRRLTFYMLREAFLVRWQATGGNPGQLALISGIAPVRIRPGQSIEPLYIAAAKYQAWLESTV